jgi:predicted DNA-binding transcriptional regulator AlpA
MSDMLFNHDVGDEAVCLNALAGSAWTELGALLQLVSAKIAEGDRTKALEAIDRVAQLAKSLTPNIEVILPRPKVLLMCGLKSPTTLYALINRGEFPSPYVLSPGRRGWKLSEVQRWIADRAKRGAEMKK